MVHWTKEFYNKPGKLTPISRKPINIKKEKQIYKVASLHTFTVVFIPTHVYHLQYNNVNKNRIILEFFPFFFKIKENTVKI